MKKSVYALFLLIVVCAFCLVGCSKNEVPSQIYEKNAFRILRQVDSNGKINLSYIFPVNSEKLEQLQFDETDVKIYKFYLSTYVSALADKYREMAGEGTKISKCVYYTDVDGVGFILEFDDLQAQKDFFKVDDEQQSDLNTQTSGFFIKKVEMKTNFPISSAEAAENLKQVCRLAMNTWSEQNQIDKQKIESFSSCLEESLFIYDTASPTNSLKSNVMYEGNGLKHNLFIKSQEEISQNAQIEFFITYPNTAIWYLSALILVPLGMLLTFLLEKRKVSKSHP